ncbi:MAG: restriction endonuclease subunit S [Pseudomonadota bacterium]
MRDAASGSWEELSLGDLVTRLVNGGTPPTNIAAYWQGSTPWITGADFTPSGLSEFRRFVSDEAVRQTATNVIAKGELLLVTRTGVGKLAIAPCDVAISQDITGVYPDRQRVAVEFLYHRMRQGVEDLKKLNQGTSINGIVRNDLVSYRIALPPLPQQQRIAEILSTVDEAIEQTEALIAKTQQIKAGLMHDLFTRGVTADGQLRPPREEAPQLYKESPLGWIPKEWDPATLNALVSPARPVVYGILMPGRGHPGGIPVIKVKDIVDGEVQGDDLLLTSPQIDAEYQRSKVRPRDVLLTIRGTVGRLAQVPTHLDGANITQDTARIGIAAGSPEFYRYYLETHVPRRHFAVNTLGQAVQGINLRDVRTTPVPIVPDDEQLKIAEIVVAVVSSERTEREHLAKLAQAKQGLMQDLLTSRVPVAVESAKDRKEVAANV